VPLPLPPTYRVKSRLTDDGVIVPCPRGVYGEDWEEEPVELDGETYLRLGAVDLDNPKAIFRFVEKYGVLGGWDLLVTLAREAPPVTKKLFGAQLNTTIGDEKKKRSLRDEQAQAGSNTVLPSDYWAFYYAETLDEFRFAARCLRDLTAAWRMFKDGTAASDVQWVSPQRLDDPFLQEDGFPTYMLEEMLPRWFLDGFSPRLAFHHTPPRAGPPWDLPPRHGGLRADPQRRPLSGELYSTCALELYNHIVENANYLICANENCQQKNFVRQQGREKNWHRSEGVSYCSYACAHAVAQRRYRRKKSNEKHGRQT
jgi:hypothetical protein